MPSSPHLGSRVVESTGPLSESARRIRLSGMLEDGWLVVCHAPKEVSISESMTATEFANHIALRVLERKGSEVSILSMASVVDYTDVVVLVTGNNPRHVRALAEDVRLWAKDDHDVLPEGVEGTGAGRWVLVDFGSVILHVFDQPMRGFYNLDGLWSDAESLSLPELVEEEEEEEEEDASAVPVA